MQLFHCSQCSNLVYFESHTCVQCGHVLAYLTDQQNVAALDKTSDGSWRALGSTATAQPYRLCANYERSQVCNWAFPAEEESDYCVACRLTRVIPDVSQPGAKEAWYKLETAKRRVVHGLISLGLSVDGRDADPDHGLTFDFLADPVEGTPVMTGHTDGAITIALAEAHDAERERRRASLHEPFRTLVGHLRHEVGHFYWDRLIRDGGRLEAFRNLFGDERADYEGALQQYYARGPGDWSAQFISAYASAHPWEDWAETWAHYMHMVDALETAEASRVALEAPTAPPVDSRDEFSDMVVQWNALTHVLNNLNRSLGLNDAYPFILCRAAVEKMHFVHSLIREVSAAQELPGAKASIIASPVRAAS